MGRDTEKEGPGREAACGGGSALSCCLGEGCDQQRQGQMQSLLGANFGFVIKNLPIVMGLPERSAAAS